MVDKLIPPRIGGDMYRNKLDKTTVRQGLLSFMTKSDESFFIDLRKLINRYPNSKSKLEDIPKYKEV